MFSDTGLSLSDIAAVTKNNSDDSWGGNGGIWVLIILFALFGWGGNGFGNRNGANAGNEGGSYPYPVIVNGGGYGGYGTASTAASMASGALDNYVLNSDFSTLSRQIESSIDGLRQQSTGIANGLCDGFYTQAQLINNTNQVVSNGFASAELSRANGQAAIMAQLNNNAVNAMQDNFAIQTAINGVNVNNNTNTQAIAAQLTANATQQASCCCDMKQQIANGFGDVAYRMATDTCSVNTNMATAARDITDNQNANTRAILDALQAQAISAKDDKISDLTAQVNALTLAASQQAQNNYIVSQLKPTPVPAYSAATLYGYYPGGCSGCSQIG